MHRRRRAANLKAATGLDCRSLIALVENDITAIAALESVSGLGGLAESVPLMVL